LNNAKFFQEECSNKYCDEREIPDDFCKFTSRLQIIGDKAFESAINIAFSLSRGHKRGRGLSCDSRTSLNLIHNGGAGVCSDYAQVFTGLCIAAGIKVREWGMCNDFVRINLGHSFNEVFSNEFGKWIFIDAYRSVFATCRGNEVPLGIREIIDLTTQNLYDQVHFHEIDQNHRGAGRFTLSDIYLNPDNIFFLLSNYNVFGQDKVLKWGNILPLPLLHILLLLHGKYQRFNIYTNDQSLEAMIGKLNSVKSICRPTSHY
jgi:hypothetical protein